MLKCRFLAQLMRPERSSSFNISTYIEMGCYKGGEKVNGQWSMVNGQNGQRWDMFGWTIFNCNRRDRNFLFPMASNTSILKSL
jgi:hypothetical protein